MKVPDFNPELSRAIKVLPKFTVPADLRKALAKTPRAQATWEDITPLARRDWVFWLISAKQAETRTRRIEKALDMLASGKRRVCCFGGIEWIIKTGNSAKGKDRRSRKSE
jgi:Bacteriocin-protection, YdeI or OmpD-Associated